MVKKKTTKYKEISITLGNKKEEFIENRFIAIIEKIPNIIEDIISNEFFILA